MHPRFENLLPVIIFMRNAFFLTCVLFFGILPLAGQSDSGGEKPKKHARSAWFACLSAIPAGLENPIKVAGGTDLTEIELQEFMTSDPVKIPADGILRIVRPVPDPEDPTKTKYLILASAKVPENVREALVILAPLPKPEGDLIFAAKIQDLASFKGGDRLYINLSAEQIRVRLGTDTVTVAPGQSDIYESPAIAKPTNVPIMYEFYAPKDKKWKMISASTIVLRPTRREIFVFNSGTRPGNVKKHGILFPVQAEAP
jgi:hypothetical protein